MPHIRPQCAPRGAQSSSRHGQEATPSRATFSSFGRYAEWRDEQKKSIHGAFKGAGAEGFVEVLEKAATIAEKALNTEAGGGMAAGASEGLKKVAENAEGAAAAAADKAAEATENAVETAASAAKGAAEVRTAFRLNILAGVCVRRRGERDEGGAHDDTHTVICRPLRVPRRRHRTFLHVAPPKFWAFSASRGRACARL